MKKTNSRSSNPESENYECLKNLQNNRWLSWRQIPSKEELLQRVISPTCGAHISLNTWWLRGGQGLRTYKHMHLLTRVYGKYAALRGLLVYSVTPQDRLHHYTYFELHNALFSMHRLDNSHFQRLSTLVHFHSRIITITVTRNVTKYTYLEQDNHRLLWLFCRFILHYSSNCNNRGICLGNSHLENSQP